MSLNAEKTRLVTITEPGASFAFLGFEFRWERNSKTVKWYSSRTPRPKKVIAVVQEVGNILRRSRHLPMQVAVAQVTGGFPASAHREGVFHRGYGSVQPGHAFALQYTTR